MVVTVHIYRLEVGMVVREPSSGGECIYILRVVWWCGSLAAAVTGSTR